MGKRRIGRICDGWRGCAVLDKIDKAVERLKLAAEMSETYYQKPLIVTTSGGKDSDVCLALAKIAGINYEVQHNHTTVDEPEMVFHVRDTFRKLELDGVKCTINWPTYKGKTDVFHWWMEDGVLPGQVELEEMDV